MKGVTVEKGGGGVVVDCYKVGCGAQLYCKTKICRVALNKVL